MTKMGVTPPFKGVIASRHRRRGDPVFEENHPTMKRPAVYILANRRNGTLYTGVTSDLPGRVYRHRHGLTPGFANRYGCRLLVYYEAHDDVAGAIAREKQIKAGSRGKKLALIEQMNPGWKDLYETLF